MPEVTETGGVGEAIAGTGGVHELFVKRFSGWPRTGRPARRAGAFHVTSAFGAEERVGCSRTGPALALYKSRAQSTSVGPIAPADRGALDRCAISRRAPSEYGHCSETVHSTQ